MLIKDFYQHALGVLEVNGVKDSPKEARELLMAALNYSFSQIHFNWNKSLSDLELDLCKRFLHRRAQGEPIQYIQGYVDFLSCRINVSPRVLIPRQETEILCQMIIDQLSQESLQGKSLWDVCCGSGCLAIALAQAFPQLEVSASDISTLALDQARENAFANRVKVLFKQGNLLQPFRGRQADFLVCNPPYISQSELCLLDKEVVSYEPHLALLGGKDGLDYYRKLKKKLPLYLLSGAKAWLELGHNQGSDVKKIFKHSPFTKTKVLKDWAGHDRFFFLEIE